MNERERAIQEKALDFQQLGRSHISRFIDDVGNIELPSNTTGAITEALLESPDSPETAVKEVFGIEVNDSQAARYAIRYVNALEAVSQLEKKLQPHEDDERFHPLLDSSSAHYMSYTKTFHVDPVELEQNLRNRNMFEEADEMTAMKGELKRMWKGAQDRLRTNEQVRDQMYECVGRVVAMERSVENEPTHIQVFPNIREQVLLKFEKKPQHS